MTHYDYIVVIGGFGRLRCRQSSDEPTVLQV